jgi:hypothetical protein
MKIKLIVDQAITNYRKKKTRKMNFVIANEVVLMSVSLGFSWKHDFKPT